jgi:eukaryotic-like serine/threonine-protein kinase
MDSLASVYTLEGKYAEAVALFGQTLEIERRVLGPEHPGTLTTMSNLAATYNIEGKNPEAAEALLSQSFEIQRRTLGYEHPDTLRSMSNLGMTHLEAGSYARAEALFRQTVDIRRRPGPRSSRYAERRKMAGAGAQP